LDFVNPSLKIQGDNRIQAEIVDAQALLELVT